MRIGFSICLLIAACSAGWSQTAPAHKAAPAKKPASAAAAKPAAPAALPTAIIETTAGKLTCTLFPDKAPIGVANFIGLAQGTKDWTNPISHAKKARRSALRRHHLPSCDSRLHDSGWRPSRQLAAARLALNSRTKLPPP